MNTVELAEIYNYLKDEMTPRVKGFIEKQQKEYSKEIKRLNNIINELEKYLIEDNYKNEDVWCITTQEVLEKLQELKGADKNCK